MAVRSTAVAVLSVVFACGGVLTAAAAPNPPAALSMIETSSDYRIGPKDTLDINVFQIDELNRTVEVDRSGKILLPLIGQIQAATRTTAELSSDIETALKQTYMKNPKVIVTVKESQSQRVTVDGAVNQPGVYPLSGPTTLIQAVSLARGPDPKLANVKKVAVFRTVAGKRQQTLYDLTRIRSGAAEDPEVFANDIVVVDSSGGKSFLQNFQGSFGLLGMLVRPW